MKPTKADIAVGIFGAWDGACSAMAYMIGGRHMPVWPMFTVGLSGAVGGMFSMGTGQWQEMDDSQRPAVKLRAALIMACSCLAGALLPVLPLLSGSKTVGVALGGALVLLLATGVWWVKGDQARDSGRAAGWAAKAAVTYGLVVVTVIATVATSSL